jgi:hypothetical protein
MKAFWDSKIMATDEEVEESVTDWLQTSMTRVS